MEISHFFRWLGGPLSGPPLARGGLPLLWDGVSRSVLTGRQSVGDCHWPWGRPWWMAVGSGGGATFVGGTPLVRFYLREKSLHGVAVVFVRLGGLQF